MNRNYSAVELEPIICIKEMGDIDRRLSPFGPLISAIYALNRVGARIVIDPSGEIVYYVYGLSYVNYGVDQVCLNINPAVKCMRVEKWFDPYKSIGSKPHLHMY